jgi:uncharacterized protein (UPF0335 family)
VSLQELDLLALGDNRIGNPEGLNMLERMEEMKSSLIISRLEALERESASLNQSLVETKQDVDTLLPYLKDVRILRKDILERKDDSSRDYDITKRRNCIAHGAT